MKKTINVKRVVLGGVVAVSLTLAAVFLLKQPKVEVIDTNVKMEAYQEVTLDTFNKMFNKQYTAGANGDVELDLHAKEILKLPMDQFFYSNPGMHRVYLWNEKEIGQVDVLFEDTIKPTLLVKYNDIEMTDGFKIPVGVNEEFLENFEYTSTDKHGETEVNLDVEVIPHKDDSDRIASVEFKTFDNTHTVKININVEYVSKEEPKPDTPKIPDTSNNPNTPTKPDYARYNAINVLVNKSNYLPKDFVPDLKEFPVQYAVSRDYWGRPIVVDAFVNMVDTMKSETGLTMQVTSSYRSYDFQTRLYNNYVKQHGQKEADRFSAKPGSSEHQTGLAIDLVAPGYSMNNFGNSQQSKWVNENAHRFGFIIRYKEGKEYITGYMPEPWHIRYLGVDLATKIYNSGLTYEEWLQQN